MDQQNFSKEKKLLLVEDDSLMLEVLKDLLSESGITVHTSVNGAEGLKKFSENKYDLIISDIQMPILNGVEFLKKVRSQDTYSPKFMLLTGYSTYKNEEVYRLGADALMNKPFEFDDLINEVHKLLMESESRGINGS